MLLSSCEPVHGLQLCVCEYIFKSASVCIAAVCICVCDIILDITLVKCYAFGETGTCLISL